MTSSLPLGSTSSTVQSLKGHTQPIPPLWLMRQAGRYLPEYRAIRSKFPSFLDFCLTPDAATDVTLQPITRFDLDAAIIFADILTIPHALGHTVTFTEGYGPKVEPITSPTQVNALKSRLEDIPALLAPVAQTVHQTRMSLPATKAVFGFSGAPWTLASYMFDSKPSQSIVQTMAFASEHPAAFASLIETLTQAVIRYLGMQIEAGANVVQVFDSWAGSCQPCLWQTAVHNPLLSITQAIHTNYPHVPVVLFPRQAKPKQLQALAEATAPYGAALALSTEVDMAWAAAHLKPLVSIQGNLDPLLLITKDATTLNIPTVNMLKAAQKPTGKGYVVNVGHGLTPETNIEAVHHLVSLVRERSYTE